MFDSDDVQIIIDFDSCTRTGRVCRKPGGHTGGIMRVKSSKLTELTASLLVELADDKFYICMYNLGQLFAKYDVESLL